MKVGLVTDGTSYFTPQEIKELNLKVIPLKIIFPDGKSVNEDELDWKEYFASLKTTKILPTTSQPSAGEFEITYKELLSQGVDRILSIHISAGISGTVQSALLAKNILASENIDVFDSWYTSCGLRFQVEEAYNLLKEGLSVEDVIAHLDYMRDNTKLLFLVDTLEYLHKGGRIGGAQALIGSMLQLKPILSIKKVVETYDKVRTKEKAINRLVDDTKKGIKEAPGKFRLAVIHVQAFEVANQIREKLSGLSSEIPIWEVGPVVGTHVGPGTVGVGFTYLI